MLIWIFNDLSLSIENMRIWTYFKLDWTLDALFARSKPIEIGNSPGHVCTKNLFRNNIFYSLWFVYLVAGRVWRLLLLLRRTCSMLCMLFMDSIKMELYAHEHTMR